MKAAVYLRVSTDKQDVRNSVARQLAACRTWAAAHGADVLEEHVYRDEVASGSTLARPGLQRILKLLRAKAAPPFDALLVDDSSRLDRGGNLAELVRLFADRDVQLIAIDSGRDLTAEDEELLVHVKAGLDSHYLREIARRTRAGLAQRALRGFWTGGTVYGYRFTKTPNGTEISIDPVQAKIVREIYRKRIAGAGYREIAVGLNETDHPSPRGGSWDPTCIRAMLLNPKYKGDWTWNIRQWKKRPESMHAETKRTARRVKLRPASDHVPLLREDLRIVSDSTWSAVAETFRNRKPGKRPTRSPIAGLARCICGGPIVRGGGPGRLTCGWAKNRGPRVCVNKRTVAEADVIGSLVKYLTAKILTPDRVKAMTARVVKAIKKRSGPASTADAQDAARARIARLETQIGRLIAALADGVDSPAIRASVADKEIKLHFARQALQSLSVPSGAIVPADPSRVRERVQATIAGLSGKPEVAREALRTVVAEIIVRDTDAGWRLQVKTRPWVLGAQDDVYPGDGSGGPFTHIGLTTDTILAAQVGRGRRRTA